ncbi:hypothetical protein [uncultured Psychrobacter sp.]|uniref:hypothetical protein n=1 Tax=uncultured Psychrobacter sp. TaxID=259303 RepID=UPI0030DBC4B4
MLDSLSFEHNELSKLLWTAALVGLIFCFGASITASDEFWIIDNQIKDAHVDYKHIQQEIQLQSAKGLAVNDLSAESDKAENKIVQLKRQSTEVVARHKLYEIGSIISLTLFLGGLAWWYIGPYKRKKRDSELTTRILELDIEIKEKELELLNKS